MRELKEIYEKVENAILKASELDKANFFNSKEEECVDARAILVNKLIDIGLTEKSIAEFSGMSQQRVNFLKNTFRKKKNKIGVIIVLKEVNKILSNSLQINTYITKR